MPAVRPNKIEMIPISRITVLNPRARNKRHDVPLSFHPAATRVLGLVTPRSVG